MITLEKLHEYIINKNTFIDSLKKETENLDGIISDFRAYSDDVYMIDNLKNLSQRMKNELKALELATDRMTDYIEQQLN